MPVCNIATSDVLFTAIEKEFGSRKIPWSNMVGYASDTASVMVGRRNSVLSRLLQKQPSLGCLCHLGTLCAAAAIKKLPVSLDYLVIDIFYHFKHSSKRWHEFNEIQLEFSNVKPLRVLCPDVIKSTEDITSIAFTDQNIQLSNDKLGICSSTLSK